MRLNHLAITMVFLSLASCSDSDIEQVVDELSNKSEPISCALPEPGQFYSVNVQGQDGVCSIDFAQNTIVYSPNSEDFSNTDFCDFNYIEGPAIDYRIIVDYSGDNDTCAVSSAFDPGPAF